MFPGHPNTACNHSKTAWAADKEYCVFCGVTTGNKMGNNPIFQTPAFDVRKIQDEMNAAASRIIKAESPPECCGTSAKLWKTDKWVCAICEKNPYSDYYYQLPEPTKKAPVCECGATVCGLNHHSHWCPLYVVP